MRLGEIASCVYAGQPADALWMIGVTGTNGKTSCSHWIAQALTRTRRPHCGDRHAGQRLSRGACKRLTNTTPDALALHARLAQLLDAGAQRGRDGSLVARA